MRFAAADASADDCVRTIEIDRARVLVQRTVGGVHMRLNLPLATFVGVAVRVMPEPADGEPAIAIVLEHPDRALSVPLHVADETEHVIADWQLWARVLRRPLLVAEGDGSLRQPFATLGGVTLGVTVPRRLRRTALRTRRPKIFRRRRVLRAIAAMLVHRGEREIIARN